MAGKLHFRQLLVLVLATVHDVSQKEISARNNFESGSVSKYLRPRQRDIPEKTLKDLLAAIPCTEAEVLAVTACLEALEALKEAGDLTDADLKEIEEGLLLAARIIRDALTQGLRRARSKPEPGYPQPADLAAHRFRAGEQLERLKAIPAEYRAEVIRSAKEFQTWALCERACEESTRQAGRDIKESLAWAQLACEIADLVEGPEAWILCLQGYSLAHVANAVRVAGEYPASDSRMVQAKSLWNSGTDVDGVLDPGRLLDLEASLRRDQRRFEEALSVLDQAASLSRNPARILISKGTTLEVMGEHEQAAEAFRRALPLVEKQEDQRLHNLVLLNLATSLCHLGHFQEALKLVGETRPQVVALGDKLYLLRVRWLEGRIAAGMKRPEEALRLLSEVRHQFAAEGMVADAAAATLEEAILLLEKGRNAEVKSLAKGLEEVLASKGVHREALAALRLFQEAAESETATVELTRDILVYLYKARHDKGLRFSRSGSH